MYHKIQSVYKRNKKDMREILMGEFSTPEFELLQNIEWTFTEKVDGMNIRIIIGNDKIVFGGRTDQARLPVPLLTRLEEIFLHNQETFLADFPEGAVLYGEGYGGNIQTMGPYYDDEPDFVLFDIRVGHIWLDRFSVEEIGKKFGVEVIPGIGGGTLFDLVERVKEGFNSMWGDFPAEGIVARPKHELRARQGHRIITKCKLKDFIHHRGKK